MVLGGDNPMALLFLDVASMTVLNTMVFYLLLAVIKQASKQHTIITNKTTTAKQLQALLLNV